MKFSAVILICIWSIFNVNGQDVTLYHTYDDGVIKLRWNPTDVRVWEDHLTKGYIIEKYEANRLVYTSDVILPGPNLIREETSDDDYYLFMISQAIHFHLVDKDLIKDSYPEDKYTPLDILESRYEISNYLQHSDYELTLYAGLGYYDNEIKQGVDYTYKLKSATNSFAPVEYKFNTTTFKKPELPELKSDWSNRRANLKWNTKDFKNDFYGWTVKMSLDDVLYYTIDTNVMVNLLDTSQNELFFNYDREIILEKNDEEHFFRLYGHNHFGDVTSYYTQVSGSADEGIAFSPLIDEVTQKSNNTCVIEWSMLEKFYPKVKEFRLYAAPNWEGPYIQDSIGISPETRELTRDILYNATYWRIAAVDKNGKETSSFPKMIMSIDTIPPAIPTNLEGTIDSSGIVQITWDKNTEDDFIGYKVFYSHDTLHEFLLDHEQYVKNSEYADTLYLITQKKFTYYKIIAVDSRNNRSDYSEILAIKKPDILPPVEPNFIASTNLEGRVALQWNPSSSDDVVTQQLYRKELKSNLGWRLLKKWNINNLETIYIDSTLREQVKYAYILTATDDSGNESIPSDPITGKAIKSYRDFPINNFDIVKNKKINIIAWNYPMEEVFEIWIYNIINEEKPRLLRKISAPRKIYEHKLDNPKEDQSYFIQVYFHDGRSTNYSITKLAK